MSQKHNFDFTVKNIASVKMRRYTSTWKMNNLCYEHSYTLTIFNDGKVFYKKTTKGDFTAEKGDIYLFSPGMRRSGECHSDKPVEFITIVFDLIFFDNSESDFCDLLYHTYNCGDIIHQKFHKIYQCWKNEEKYYQLKCRAMLQEILYMLLVFNSRKRVDNNLKNITPVEEYIRSNFTKNITLEELSAISNRSISYISKLFSVEYGISPKQYILDLRMNHAQKLLRTSNLSISEISTQCGFDDVFYFSRLYKSKIGISPSAERKTRIE